MSKIVRRQNSHLRLVAGIDVGTVPHPRVAARLVDHLKRQRQVEQLKEKETLFAVEEARNRLKAVRDQADAALKLLQKALKVGNVSEDELWQARGEAHRATVAVEKEPA